jgi:hypothetical protein
MQVSVTFWISTNITSSRIKYINLAHNMPRLLYDQVTFKQFFMIPLNYLIPVVG